MAIYIRWLKKEGLEYSCYCPHNKYINPFLESNKWDLCRVCIEEEKEEFSILLMSTGRTFEDSLSAHQG